MSGSDDDKPVQELPKVKLPELYKLVDEKKENLIEVLKKAVAIPSISHKAEHFPDIIKMLNMCKKELEDLGGFVEIVENKALSDDGVVLPPVLLANVFVDDQLKTICVYGHVDTMPADKDDGWETEPFEMTEKDGRLYGRGVSDNKGPLLCWFNALKFYKMKKYQVPVNIKFVIDGAAELQSRGLDQILWIKQGFFSDVEYLCFTIDKKIHASPCLVYGFRGVCHFTLDVNCGKRSVHTGTYGGAFNQPLLDAVNIVSSLIDKRGKIAVPDALRDVIPVSPREEDICKAVPFDINQMREHTGAMWLQHKEDGVRLIMHKTRLPSISVHSFDQTSDPIDPKNLASIPNRVVAKFSIRTVPNQTADETFRHLENHIKKTWNRYKSVNQYSFKMNLAVNPWREDPFTPHFEAAALAIESLYNVRPTFVCEGCTIAAVSMLKTTCAGSSLLVLPISGYDDLLHTNKESISVDNYTNGVKLVMAYICHVFEI